MKFLTYKGDNSYLLMLTHQWFEAISGYVLSRSGASFLTKAVD